MHRFLTHIVFVALLALGMGGCATRSVDVVQSEQFKLMADRMSEELIARNILDTSRNYTPGLWGAGANYGEELFRRLSPAFLLDGAVSAMTGNSFAQSMRASERVETRPEGFTIIGSRRQIRVDMVAVTDWDGDGRKDWVVACDFRRAKGAIPHIFYLIIPEPASHGPLKGVVAAVYEDLGVTGRLYVRDSQIKKDQGPVDDMTPAAVEEAVPGLKPVTMPPSVEREKGGAVKERLLE